VNNQWCELGQKLDFSRNGRRILFYGCGITFSIPQKSSNSNTDMKFKPLIPLLFSLFSMSDIMRPSPAQAAPAQAARIDRRALVTRHDVVLTTAQPNERLQVGNGAFALGLDPTGLQTFYGNTLSDQIWHSNPLPPGQQVADFRLKAYDAQNRKIGYATDASGQTELYDWLRENPHRFNLGRLQMRLSHRDGTPATLADIREIRQHLELWKGLVTSHFNFDGEPVTVETCVHPQSDTVAVKVESKLIAQNRLAIALEFPAAKPDEDGADWTRPEAHSTTMAVNGAQRADFARVLDATHYVVNLAWQGKSKIAREKPHRFVLSPQTGQNSLEMSCRFTRNPDPSAVPSIKATQSASAKHWRDFWRNGGAIDLSGSTDPRWMELERRIVLSQYLLGVQEAGPFPPQESGLFNISGWNGKFHLEMHLWHGAQWALWNRWPLFQRSLDWYPSALQSSRERAKSQGYQGARWPKMTEPSGLDSPSGTGPLLIWQQVNPIFYAEMDYRLHPTRATLEKWRPIIDQTAEFMASFPTRNPATGQYDLDSPIKTVPENTDPEKTRNPTFELSYWRFGLRVAQEWRTRLGLPRQANWDEILTHLAPLPQENGAYLQQEGMSDTYTAMNWEHPSLIGMLGLLPGDGVDKTVMKNTVLKTFKEWQWDKVWGWDFPMMAMAAARNGEPKMAVDALLLDSPRNHFLANGTSTGGPFPYFPSNGGLLYAVALMVAGWDGAPSGNAPGFPTDGKWKVRFENLNRAL